MDEVLLGRETRELLGVSNAVIYRLRNEGVLRVRYPGGHFSRNEVRSYRDVQRFKRLLDARWSSISDVERRLSLDLGSFVRTALEVFPDTEWADE